ncbi:MAG: type II toxin-antitoxin system MqsR family toxin [Betaproteobacteria bacterium]|nr:type II toxin-antitoxin system MqsR family toxin [Betaproteobacteria bacterium]
MEKRTPHYRLTTVKSMVKTGDVRATASAYQGARELGIDDLDGMCAVVLALAPADFHKSMTTHADHTVWQDVYRPGTQAGDAYLKLTVIDDVLIVSFKEL